MPERCGEYLHVGGVDMLVSYELDIGAELEYAKKWVFNGNPDFYDFTELGGDCTNFISQCLYAGGAVMNYTPDLGWYYISLSDRAAAWTSVQFFHDFMVTNKSAGPYGEEVPLRYAAVGDVVQLGTDDSFYHSLLVTGIADGVPYVTARTRNVLNVPLYSYNYRYARCIHITGARKWA